MKKLVILLSLATVAFAAIGCGDSSEPGSSTTPAGEVNPTAPPEGAKPAVGTAQGAPTPTMPPK